MNIRTILWIILILFIGIIVFATGIGLAILSALFMIFLRCIPYIIVILLVILVWRYFKKSKNG